MTFNSIVPMHRVPGFGSRPPSTFVALCELGVAGRSVPLMSPDDGCAAVSSFTSLHRTPCHPEPRRMGFPTVERQQGLRPRVAGARRSEVKEEGRPQAGPGDRSGGGHPPPSAVLRWSN
jgi:hypothetical protein